jgi:hypothetical protein
MHACFVCGRAVPQAALEVHVNNCLDNAELLATLGAANEKQQLAPPALRAPPPAYDNTDYRTSPPSTQDKFTEHVRNRFMAANALYKWGKPQQTQRQRRRVVYSSSDDDDNTEAPRQGAVCRVPSSDDDEKSGAAAAAAALAVVTQREHTSEKEQGDAAWLARRKAIAQGKLPATKPTSAAGSNMYTYSHHRHIPDEHY